MSAFKDYFSRLPETYATYRPVQPEALLDWVVSLAPRRAVAWDCGTGNGQVARGLAAHFDRVIATDASAAQIAQAPPLAGVEYRIARAESSGLANASIDLVTVAQALHWFDLDAFYRAVQRVLAPGGAIVAWTYMHPRIDDRAVNDVFARFSLGALGPYWPPERQLITDGYRTVPFPFDEIIAPPFEMTMQWTLDELAGYLRSWSATSRFVAQHDRDPVDDFVAEVRDAWGSPDVRHTVRWAFAIRAGR